LQRDLRLERTAGASDVVISQPPALARPQADPGRFSRFSVTVLLWLVLVGSLGMLLQAVVRERSNRALESLLAAARPSEIVLGKLLGVGALAVLVMSVWLLGAAAAAASPAVRSSPMAILALQPFGDAKGLLVDVLLFVLAFFMYGAAIIGLGAIARDMAAAQNLSRPVFVLLLAIFFFGLGEVSGAGAGVLPTLALLPPFAPFALLLAAPGAVQGWRLVAALTGVGATSLLCLWLAAEALKGEPLVKTCLRRVGVSLVAGLTQAGRAGVGAMARDDAPGR
jgi:ABC-2 type transport system permease protein